MISIVEYVFFKVLRGIVKFFPFRYSWQREYYQFRLSHIANPRYKQAFEQDFRKKYEQSIDLHGYDYQKLWRDFYLCWILIGAEPEDYYHYELFRKDWLWRNHHTTRDRLNFFKLKVNDPKMIPLLNDKETFNTIWSSYLGRRWCIPSQVSESQFTALFRNCDMLIVKNMSGSGGHGIYTIPVKQNLDEIYSAICAAGKEVIVEEYFHQKGFLHDINPSSLNTLRIVTVRIGGGTEVILAAFRCGSTDAVIDNLHEGGFLFPINLRTGELETGNNYVTRNVCVHPKTGIQITGTLVPDWQRIKDYCCEAHQLAPEGLAWIGWDVCWSEGDLLLIEGNASPGFNPLNNPDEDMWGKCREILCALDKESN